MNSNGNLKHALLIGLLSVFATPQARAAFVYLHPYSIDLRKFPPPPRRGSAADEKDLDGVRRFQKTRTRSECARATDEAGASLKSFFGMGRAVLSRDELLLVAGLFQDILDDADEFAHRLKRTYARPRPFIRDANIELCVPSVNGFSYPSAHAVFGRVAARTFGLIFRDRIDELLDRGDEIGLGRVIGGVHHPLDVAAGQLLGDEVFQALTKSEEFMHRIEKIRSRIRLRDRER